MSLISLLIVVIVLGLLFYILQLLPLPQPFLNVARAILAVICIIWLLSRLGWLNGGTLIIK